MRKLLDGIRTLRGVLALLVVSGPLLGEDTTADEGFVVQSSVSVGSSSTTSHHTTTIFRGDRVYDVVHGNPPAIARFDFQTEQVVLVDRARRVRWSTPFEALLKFEAGLRDRARQRDGLGAFLSRPTFASHYDATQNTLTLSSPWLRYHVEVTGESPAVIEQVSNFANWSARLTSMRYPAALPASVRLAVNAALAEQGWRAVRVVREGGERLPGLGAASSRHQLRAGFTDADRELIQAIEEELEIFPEVSFAAFHSPPNSSPPTKKR